MAICGCGCGAETINGNKFIHGHNARVAHPMWGKKHTSATREKMRASHNDWQRGELHPMFGKNHSLESRKKMSKSHLGIALLPNHRENLTKANRKLWESLTDTERKNRHSRMWAPTGGNSPAKGIKHSDEAKRKNRKSHIKLWQDPEHARKCLVFNSPNSCEKKLLDVLESMYPNEWKFVGDGQVVIDGKIPDFINANGHKKIIELFGEFWHEKEEENKRKNSFAPFGYETLVVWVKELDAPRRLRQKLEAFCRSESSTALQKGGCRYGR